jgi:FkbM family methyltransferase
MKENPFGPISSIASLSRQELEQTSTHFAKHYYLGSNLLLCRILTKYRIYLDGREVGVTPNILTDGYWESWITKFIAKTVKPGSICIDAGANFGYYSVMMAELSGKEGQTVAIEPNSYLAKLLSFTSKLNEYRFKVVQKALSEKRAEVTLSVPPDFWGGGTIRTTKLEDHKATETVTADTMDNMVKELGLPRVDFIKMDCEGVEPQIFEGMKETLSNNPDIGIVMEYSPFLYDDAVRFTAYLLNNFNVNEITGNSELVPYRAEDIKKLLALGDHIDMYLTLKKK